MVFAVAAPADEDAISSHLPSTLPLLHPTFLFFQSLATFTHTTFRVAKLFSFLNQSEFLTSPELGDWPGTYQVLDV